MKTFKEIEFKEGTGKYASTVGMYLPGRVWVLKPTVGFAWAFAQRGLNAKDGESILTTASLYGLEKWRQLKMRRRFPLGRCIKYFVTEGMLPLRELNPGKGGTRKYIRVQPSNLENQA